MNESGLREQKKNQTRVLIADTAARLFGERGFDAVTVDEIARAAMVSKKTVFNYFPSKEDLVFDRARERLSETLETITHRPPGTPVLEAFRRAALARADEPDALRARLHSRRNFFALVDANPALGRRLHDLHDELVTVAAHALAEETGVPPEDPVPAVVARTLVGTNGMLFRRLRARFAADEPTETIAVAYRREVEIVFDVLARGLADYPTA